MGAEVNEEFKNQNQELGRGKRTGKVKGKSSRARVEVTERDADVVEWLGRHRLATAEQVMRRFGMQRSKAYQRLAVLVDHGLVRYDQGVRTARVYLATAKGLRYAGLDLPKGRVSPATAMHDLAVVDAAIPLEASLTTLVLTEREIRRADQRSSTRFRITASCEGAGQSGMWPDLVTVDRLTGELRAIEVELTLKKHDRIVDKLVAYSGSAYATVTYQCAIDGIARAVAKAAASSGMTNRLAIERIGTHVAAKPRSDGELERLLEVIRYERQRAEEQTRRAEQAMVHAVRERDAGFALIDEIARYLAADRTEQRATRGRWLRMTQDLARARHG